MVLSLVKTVAEVASRRLTVREVAAAHLERARRLGPALNCFLSLADDLDEQALLVDKALARGVSLPLAGAVISVKDLIHVRGMETSGGSLAPHLLSEANREASVISGLRRVGAVFLGKTNLHEFAFGITSENEHFGPVLNPWDRRRVAGGSSGGSAAALAVGLGNASLGTDTRGSIRIPAACCGICGLKPTRGAVSLGGVIPLSPSLDHVGPMARDLDDLDLLWISLKSGGRAKARNSERANAGSLRVGVADYYFADVVPEIASVVRTAVGLLEEHGCQIVPVPLEGAAGALAASDVLSRAEAVAVHDHGLCNYPNRYGPQVRTRLQSGYAVTTGELNRAREERTRIALEFQRIFHQVDVIAAPTIPISAPPLGTRTVSWGDREETLVSAMVRFNAPQNMAGIPALSLPCGFDRSGLPIGLQLIGARGQEQLLLDLGRHYQRFTEWHSRFPLM